MSSSPPIIIKPGSLRRDYKLNMLPSLFCSKPFRSIALAFCAVVTVIFLAPRLFTTTNVHEILNAQRLEFLNSQKLASYIHNPFETVDWSRFAYTQYATNEAYLCNSVMIFEALDRLGSKANRLLMYPSEWSELESMDKTSELLGKAKSHGAKLQPIKILRKENDDPNSSSWYESFTKLLVFNQTQYDRILNVDSDSTILQNMDELFLMPHSPLAVPRGYWLDQKERILSTQLMLVEPSDFEFDRIMNAIEHRQPKDFDMEIITNLYRDHAMILPHRTYDLITGELRVGKDANHVGFLGSQEEKWDAEKAVRGAKFVHFSDWPVMKPWQETPNDVLPNWTEMCALEDGKVDRACNRNRILWQGLYADFKQRRKEICGLEMLPSRRIRRDW